MPSTLSRSSTLARPTPRAPPKRCSSRARFFGPTPAISSSELARVRTLARRKAAVKGVTPARTFPAALPFFRLDRIYVRGFTVEHAEVLHGTLWAKLSDHAPIVASLSLN